MANSVIGSLRVNLGLDSAEFARGAKRVDAPLKRMKTQFLAISGVAAAMGGAISAAALKAGNGIDIAAKSARRLDSSIGGFRALELAAGEAGVSLSGLTSDVQTMNREIAKIGTSGNADRALEALNLSAQNLAGLDADEKLATIADSVKNLGLNSAETTAILQDLGVRNREMALLVLSGGDAIRAARGDIEDYGLAISGVDAARIEAANDAIGRLGVVTQYAGEMLAVALVPALGAMAAAITDSMREGGLLRGVLDGITNNIDVMAYSVGVAATAFGARYVGAMALSATATFSLTGALVALRRALITTGIGAVVVGAGYLIAKFSDLVTSTGGVGKAFALLGEVAVGVWDGIGVSAAAIPPALASVWQAVKANFYSMLGSLQEAWSGFLGDMAAGVDGVPFMGRMYDGLAAAQGNAFSSLSKYDALSRRAIGTADTLRASASSLAREGFETAAASLAKLNAQAEDSELATVSEGVADLNEAVVELGGGETLDDFSSSAVKAGKAISSSMSDAEKAAMAYADTMDGQVQDAVVNVSDTFIDFVGDGLKDFNSFANSVLDGFKDMILNMVKYAAQNKILLSFGGSVSGTAAAAASGTSGGIGGASGFLNGLSSTIFGGFGSGASLAGGLGSLAGGSGLIGGAGNVLSGFATGGFSGAGASISASLSGATAGLSGAATAVGSIALPVLAVAGIVSFFKKKTKIIDSGIRATVDMERAVIESFKKIRTSRFFGLSKSTKYKYSKLSASQSAGIRGAISSVQDDVLAAASGLGVSAKVFDKFSYRFKLSLKGLSEEKQQEKITQKLTSLGNSMANFVRGIRRYRDAGEGSYAALVRLSTALTTVNDAFVDLGFSAYNISLAGANAADTFAKLFGSLEGFTSATSAYYGAFYSEQEKLDNATGRLTMALNELGVNVIPNTNAAYRELVETAITSDSELAASLISLAPSFDAVTEAAQSLSDTLTASINEENYATGVDYQRGIARAGSGLEYTPEASQAAILLELQALNASISVMQSTAEITAANTGKTADNTDEQVLLTLEGAA